MESLLAAQQAEVAALNAKITKLKNRNKKSKSDKQELAMLESQLLYLEDAHAEQRESLQSAESGAQASADGAHGADDNVDKEIGAPQSSPGVTAQQPSSADTAASAHDRESSKAGAGIGDRSDGGSGSDGGGGGGGKSKAQKRREKKELEERERARRIAEAKPEDGTTKRELEYAALNSQLEPLSLRTIPIEADGHCMFKAVSVQLPHSDTHSVAALRKLVADELRRHRDEYVPFLVDDNGDMLTEAKYAAYCDEIEKTAKWGGQCELKALSAVLKRPIKVFQANGRALEIEAAGSSGDKIMLSYHQHDFSLGAHYNAVAAK